VPDFQQSVKIAAVYQQCVENYKKKQFFVIFVALSSILSKKVLFLPVLRIRSGDSFSVIQWIIQQLPQVFQQAQPVKFVSKIVESCNNEVFRNYLNAVKISWI